MQLQAGANRRGETFVARQTVQWRVMISVRAPIAKHTVACLVQSQHVKQSHAAAAALQVLR